MSTFLVFGASGAVGAFLLPRLRARGDRVVAVSRAPRAGADGVNWIRAGLPGAFALPEPVDAVLSLGPLDAFAEWLDGAATPGLERVVAIGSMSAESKRESPDPAERALAARLLAAEDRVMRAARTHGIAATVLRPTLVYGAGTDRSLAPLARLARRWRILPAPLGAHGLRQPVHADDVAAAVVAAFDCPAAHGVIYPLGGGERLAFRDMLLRLRAATPGFVLPLPLPRALVRWRAGAGVADRLGADLLADNAAATRDFGYAPRAFAAADVIGGSAARA